MTAASNIAGAILEATALTSGAEPGPQQPLSLPVQLPSMLPLDLDCKSVIIISTFLIIFFKVVNRQETFLTRKVGSCESLHDEVKRFKSSREDCCTQKFGSLDSLQAAGNGDEGEISFYSLNYFKIL